MEIGYIHEFLTLATICNYGEAADQLYISQSSLFKHIKSLETELGVPLFNKTGKRIMLSEYGSIFVKYANRIVDADNAYKSDLRQAISAFENTLFLWTNYQINDLVRSFYDTHRDININIDTGSFLFSDVRKALSKRRHELYMLTDSEPFAQELVTIPFTTDALTLVVYEDHPLVERESVFIGELVNERFVMFPIMDDVEGDPIANVLQAHPFAPHVVMTGSQYYSILETVANKIGISLLFENIVGDIRIKGIRTVPLLPRITHQVSLCYLKDTALSPAAAAFVDFVRSLNEEEHTK